MNKSTNQKRKKKKNNQKNKSKNNNNTKVSRTNQRKSRNQGKSRKAKSNKNNNRKTKEIMVRVYGDYHCKECNVRWSSSRTYQSMDKRTLYSQECLECGYGVYAYYVHDLCDKCNNWPCRCEKKVYGYYECRNCKKDWQSAYTWMEKGTGRIIYGQQCKRCKLYNKAKDVEELIGSNRQIKRPHERSLCGKCQKNGYPCDDSYW